MRLPLIVLGVAAVTVAAASANDLCPVLPDEVADPSIYTMYEGQRISFCCSMCRQKFLADPTDYLENLNETWGLSSESKESTGSKSHENDLHDATVHTSEPEQAHDHEQDHGGQAISGVDRLILFLGKFHPVVVHFPIALLVGSALAELLAWTTGRRRFYEAGRFCILVGAVGGVLAVGLGWSAAGFANYPDELSRLLEWHRWLGTSVGVVAICAAAIGEISWQKQGSRIIYRLFLFAGSVLVGVAGHFGSTLVYGTDHFRW